METLLKKISAQCRIFSNGFEIEALFHFFHHVCFRLNLGKSFKQLMILKTQDYTQAFASATFGGVCATIVGHPLDTVKIRIQNNAFSIQQLWKGLGDQQLL